MQKKMHIAYLGNGKSTNRYHIPFAMLLRDKICIKAVWERTDRSKEWARIPGVIYTTRIEEILHDPEIDVVIITTPPAAHRKMAESVLRAGKNCVCEKPFALSLEEAKEMFDLAKEKNVMLQCYQNRRFDSDFLTVQKVIKEGKLGPLYEMEMHFDYYRPEVPVRSQGYSRQDSFLYSHACHTIDQVLCLFGRPDEWRCDVKALLGAGRMNDYFDIDLFYGTLKVSVRSSYFRVKRRPSFLLNGQRGMFIKETPDKQETDLKHFYMPWQPDFGKDVPEEFGTLTYYDEENRFHEEKVPSVPGSYAYYYDSLYETIVSHKPPLVSEAQTLLQMEILEDCIREMELSQ